MNNKIPLKTAIMISGRGSNLQNLINQSINNNLLINIVHVISNNPKAPGLDIAKHYNIQYSIIDNANYHEREKYDKQLNKILQTDDIDLICLAGFRRILGEQFVTTWKNKIINIHPSLLPSFKGLQAQQKALDYGVRIVGCTVHYVEKEVDKGRIIAQAALKVNDGDTTETLSNRILTAEHICYPYAIRKIYNENKETMSDIVAQSIKHNILLS